MSESNPINRILGYRQDIWLNHCSYVLEQLFKPYFKGNNSFIHNKDLYAAVVIDTRINQQWLFTILNSVLMSPKGTKLVILTDNEGIEKGKLLLNQNNINLALQWISIESIKPKVNLTSQVSFNQLCKSRSFWSIFSEEQLLFVQTDALIVEPIPEFFFKFPYLGAPFRPCQKSEYFESRNKQGELSGFFKVDTPIHSSPHPEVYPHLYGNGGLSIRNRSLMQRICEEHGPNSLKEEQEDVFFSRHISKYCTPVPIQIAQTFACESIYNETSIGSHSAWKYFTSGELSIHLERHLKQCISLI